MGMFNCTPGGSTATTRLSGPYVSVNDTCGTIEVYQDTSPDASFDPNPPNPGVPADFIDGGLPILTGSFTRFVVQSNNFTQFKTGNIEGDIVWTGGTLYNQLTLLGDQPCPGLFTGGSTWNPPLLPAGYLFLRRQDRPTVLTRPRRHVGQDQDALQRSRFQRAALCACRTAGPRCFIVTHDEGLPASPLGDLPA
jgi:hypothetical protein